MPKSLVRLWIVLAAFLPALAAGAQSGGASDERKESGARVHGYVVNAADGSPLPDAMVQIVGERGSRVRTSSSGAFVFNVKAFPARLAVQRIGYSADTTLIEREGRMVVRLRPSPLLLSPAVIAAERSYSAASSTVIRELDITLRPRNSAQDLLRLAPGLVVAQHAGGGKAEQLYLRGFDADHGTDVAVNVDGIPVNMVSHAHGQGYADLHWLIPDVVERADVRKGPFDARDGDFATAGSVSFRTLDRVGPDGRLSTRFGAFGTRQALGIVPFGGDADRPGGYVAAAAHLGDGPFLSPQLHERFNLFARSTVPLGGAELVGTLSAFSAKWNASGQVPDRAVRSGLIPRFGAIDDSEGGQTSRYDVWVGLRSRGQAAAWWEARVFATRYRFDLFSNFTFFAVDSVHGDGIEQVDDRVMFGAFAAGGRPMTVVGTPGVLTFGAGSRSDGAGVALHAQQERTRLGTRVNADVRQDHFYQWMRYEMALSPRLRADLGVRADLFRFSVHDRVTQTTNDGLPHGSGTRWEGIVSPRLNVAFDARHGLTLFANAGTGFHSNDARDVILSDRSAQVLPRAVSAEFGVRRNWTDGSLALAAWWLDLESETVFVGDEGTTEASGRTRRVGTDIEARQRLLANVWFDADINFARGRYRDEPLGTNRIPLAPTQTATAGLTVRDALVADAGIRVRHIAGRAAIEDNSVRATGHTLWEVFSAWQVGRARLHAAVENLFNSRWNEAQFTTTSRLRGEPAPVTELHFTPGAPRAFSVGVEWRF